MKNYNVISVVTSTDPIFMPLWQQTLTLLITKSEQFLFFSHEKSLQTQDRTGYTDVLSYCVRTICFVNTTETPSENDQKFFHLRLTPKRRVSGESKTEGKNRGICFYDDLSLRVESKSLTPVKKKVFVVTSVNKLFY